MKIFHTITSLHFTKFPLFFVFILFALSCKPEIDVSYCDTYFNGGPRPQPGVSTIYPSYKMALFVDDPELTIFYIKQKRKKSEIVRYKVEKGKSKNVYEHKELITKFDYNDSGDMVFLDNDRLFVLAEGESNPVEVILSEDIWSVKWNGDKLICKTDFESFVELDQSGNILHQWDLQANPQAPSKDFWVKDSIFLVANIDLITAYSFPDLTFKWSLQTQPYFDRNSVSTTISIDGKYDLVNGLTKIAFSTSKQIYIYDLNSKEVISLWENSECYTLESGISISSDGSHIITSISTLYPEPKKQAGLMLLDLEGGWEVLEL